MRFVSGPMNILDTADEGSTPIVLFSKSSNEAIASAGWAAAREIQRRELEPEPVAWDLLAIALSVVVADGAVKRDQSVDGWTREIDLAVSLSEASRWAKVADPLVNALAFLTTDRWGLSFRDGGIPPSAAKKPHHPTADSVALLSGGLDSLIGAIDLSAAGQRLLAVSQTVRGDADKQTRFAKVIGGGLEHLQLNHNASTRRGVKETSQRSRSFIFLAFAVLAATSTRRYKDGETVPLYLNENGFIAMNPPLTQARIGSLSTRTAHPEFLARMQAVFDLADLHVQIINPYEEKTKGEMLRECADQDLLRSEAPVSTSCGRFQRFNYTHCGRCVPCQIRRASFLAWGENDSTTYVYENLGIRDADHADFDDVQAVSMARLTRADQGLDAWLGPALSYQYIVQRDSLRAMLDRGLDELGLLHDKYGLS
jgi:7-cyano-7-deazaguanine synthase in queuosine biosynthesis